MLQFAMALHETTYFGVFAISHYTQNQSLLMYTPANPYFLQYDTNCNAAFATMAHPFFMVLFWVSGCYATFFQNHRILYWQLIPPAEVRIRAFLLNTPSSLMTFLGIKQVSILATPILQSNLDPKSKEGEGTSGIMTNEVFPPVKQLPDLDTVV